MTTEDLPYEVENIRFDVEPDGAATIWFDLTGERFTEPEAMANMFVDFDDLLDDMQTEEPDLFSAANGPTAQNATDRHDLILDRLNEEAINWPDYLHDYLDRQVDIEVTENERVGWLNQRRQRAADPGWQKLSTAGQNPDPSWDEVANRLIDDMNTAVIALYPELGETTQEVNDQLREILEFSMHRLANEVVGLVKKSRG